MNQSIYNYIHWFSEQLNDVVNVLISNFKFSKFSKQRALSKCKLSYVCTGQLLTLESLVHKGSLAGRSQSPAADNCSIFQYDDIQTKLHICDLVYTSVHHFVVPRHRGSTLGRRAFSVAGPMAWNALPDDLRDPSLSADNFRKKLKTHLFRNALGHLAH